MNKTINNSVNCNRITSRDYAFGVEELPTVIVTQLQLHTTEEPVNKGTYKDVSVTPSITIKEAKMNRSMSFPESRA